MRYILILSLFLTSLYGCEDKNAREGCQGPDRFVFKEARAAFLENGLVLLETKQDSDYVKINIPYVSCQPCTPVNTTKLKLQKDNGQLTFNYLITCGMKYDDTSRTYTYPPTPRIVIYSIKPL